MAKPVDWADLPYFLAIARAGSLRTAADAMGATHATVDRRLRQLEDSYGVRLFERSVQGLVLSEAGRTLLPLAESAEEAITGARRRVQGLDLEAKGRVRISISPTMAYDVLPQIFREFSEQYPDIDLEIDVSYRMQDLTRHEADVSVRVAYEVTDDVVGRRILTYTKGIFAARAYVEEHMETAGPQGEGLHWIGWGETDPRPEWVRTSPFPKAEIRHNVRDGLMHLYLVEAGLGMSYMPTYAARRCPDIMQVPGTDAAPDRSIWILLHSDLRETTRVRLLVDFLSNRIRARRTDFEAPEL